MPPNITQLHVSVLGIRHLQVVHNLLISPTICLAFTLWGIRDLSYKIGDMAVPPNIYNYMFRPGIGHLQVVHNLLISYTIFVGFSPGWGGGRRDLVLQYGEVWHASQYDTTTCFGLYFGHLQLVQILLINYTIYVGFYL